jgi:hypothetical protein
MITHHKKLKIGIFVDFLNEDWTLRYQIAIVDGVGAVELLDVQV